MIKLIIKELQHHAPFTAVGALIGIVFMFLFRNISQNTAHDLFYVFHPAHVLLSALATASMYRKHTCPCDRGKCSLWFLLIIGYVGAIGVATLSDSIIPHIGEKLMGLPEVHAHIGFMEKGWLISIMAVLGILIAYFNPTTIVPHSAHVFISTWASLFHVMMAAGRGISWPIYMVIFLFLFVAVWIPCCVSDIVFPLLFVKERE
jgi:hypothetical protein